MELSAYSLHLSPSGRMAIQLPQATKVVGLDSGTRRVVAIVSWSRLLLNGNKTRSAPSHLVLTARLWRRHTSQAKLGCGKSKMACLTMSAISKHSLSLAKPWRGPQTTARRLQHPGAM